MINKKFISKSLSLALSVMVAGNLLALGTDGSVFSKVTGNPVIIGDVVNAAEVTPVIPWSTAYVYGLFPIDTSAVHKGGSVDGKCVNMNYVAGSWTAHFETATALDGQVLQYQYLTPDGFFTKCNQLNSGYYWCDASLQKYLKVYKVKLATHIHLWEYTKDEFVAENTSNGDTNLGTAWYEAVDEGLYYRVTCSYNSIASDNVTCTQGLASFIEVKATGEVYGFMYEEPVATYNDILAKEIIYSCAPTELQ